MSLIVCDIGGTHIRLAVAENGALSHIEKYSADRFDKFEDCLNSYTAAARIDTPCSLRIATAAYPDTDGCWRFINKNRWIIDPAALRTHGWDVQMILNDFEAATASLSTLTPADLQILHEPPRTATEGGLARCLLGPGTGLGLGYLLPPERAGERNRVLKTHGGHFAASAANEEQSSVIANVRAFYPCGHFTVFENLVSGSGLMNIYRAVCVLENRNPATAQVQDLPALAAGNDPQVRKALRLFHEFMGLFAQTATLCGHAYGGLYLAGGVLDRLAEAGLSDYSAFHRYFVPAGSAVSVRQALENTPVYYVREPYPALRGLLAQV